jgi:regulator of nonsense transcripts 2
MVEYFLTLILQTRTVELPSDSGFAVALINKRQAQREEKERIKNLVLNLDLRDSEEQDGIFSTLYSRHAKTNTDQAPPGPERVPAYFHNSGRRQGKERAGQRVRKLQLSDVEWYVYESRKRQSGTNAMN